MGCVCESTRKSCNGRNYRKLVRDTKLFSDTKENDRTTFANETLAAEGQQLGCQQKALKTCLEIKLFYGKYAK